MTLTIMVYDDVYPITVGGRNFTFGIFLEYHATERWLFR